MHQLHNVSPTLSSSMGLTVGCRVKSWYATVLFLFCIPQTILAAASSLLYKYIEPMARAHCLAPGVIVYLSAVLFLLTFVYGV